MDLVDLVGALNHTKILSLDAGYHGCSYQDIGYGRVYVLKFCLCLLSVNMGEMD